jgi:hypothetical protein
MQIVNEVHAVSSARVAEAAKLGKYFSRSKYWHGERDGRLCYALNIDTWEVIRAAATKPFGFMPFIRDRESAVTAFRSIRISVLEGAPAWIDSRFIGPKK